MNSASPLVVVEGEDSRILIPEGTYEFFFSHWETALYLGKYPKAYLSFFVGSGEYQGLILLRCYNVNRLTTPAGPNGGFSISRCRDYYKEFVACLGLPDSSGSLLPDRYDRMVLGDVVTVRTNRKGHATPDALWYSQIGSLRPLPKKTESNA